MGDGLPLPVFVREALDEMQSLLHGHRDLVFAVLDGEVEPEDLAAVRPDGRIEYLHGLVNGWADAVEMDIDDAHELAKESWRGGR